MLGHVVTRSCRIGDAIQNIPIISNFQRKKHSLASTQLAKTNLFKKYFLCQVWNSLLRLKDQLLFEYLIYLSSYFQWIRIYSRFSMGDEDERCYCAPSQQRRSVFDLLSRSHSSCPAYLRPSSHLSLMGRFFCGDFLFAPHCAHRLC